ncbi:MAG: SAM-dependent chlorinase/fluorinase [Bacteroidia bacterium]|nr:SAM-dependent chlorinase/fluorinase [Bacteroidia bacterium]
MSTIITLTTDWGLRDFFVAALKGAVINLLPQISFVDVTHIIPRGDIGTAAYNLKNAWYHFPVGTIHFVGIDTEGFYTNNLLVFEYEQHYFVGFNSGVFSMFLDNVPTKLYQYNFEPDARFNYKHLAEIANCIVSKQSIETIASPINNWLERSFLVPSPEADFILGQIIYIDTYGNLITNIEASVFEFLRNSRPFEIQLRVRGTQIRTISKWYTDVEQGEIVALFNEAGFLEIAINNASADKLLGYKHSNNIRVEFNDRKDSKVNY